MMTSTREEQKQERQQQPEEDPYHYYQEWFQNFSQAQYRHVEKYCNAQTRFQNAILLEHSNDDDDDNDENRFSYAGTTSSNTNSSHTRRTILIQQRMVELQIATQKVQTDLDTLKQVYQKEQQHQQQRRRQSTVHRSMDTRQQPREGAIGRILGIHLDRSKRVLQTIFEHGGSGRLHSNGIPMPNQDDIRIKTVSLSVLRASILQVEQNLEVTKSKQQATTRSNNKNKSNASHCRNALVHHITCVYVHPAG